MSRLIESYDVGSLPDIEFSEGSIVNAFLGKIKAGLDIPNYPQGRDMIGMFIEMLNGLMKFENRYVAIDKIKVKRKLIAEVEFIVKNIKYISELINSKVRVKVCVTGPYTLSQVFLYRYPDLFLDLARALAEIVRENTFNLKYGFVDVVAIDEPSFGLLSDPLIDKGSKSRENLLKAWEKIFKEAKKKKAKTVIHLHSTSDPLFWEIKSLDVIESHIDDFIYTSRRVRNLLETYDKFLKVSICKTNFDELIIDKVGKKLNPQELASIWREIKRSTNLAFKYLEDINLMVKRIKKVISLVGLERVIYAGPECGLLGFPNYDVAIEYLSRVSKAVNIVNREIK